MAILMPYKVKCHTVPRLKALTHGINYTSGNGRQPFNIAKNQFQKYSFCFIIRSKDGFIWLYLSLFRLSWCFFIVFGIFCLFDCASNKVKFFHLVQQKAPSGWKVFMAISLIGLVYPCNRKKTSIWGNESWADLRRFSMYATTCLHVRANFCYKWTSLGRYAH